MGRTFLTALVAIFALTASAQYRRPPYGDLYESAAVTAMREDVRFLSSAALEQCVEPFETFFNISTEKNNKDVAAQYLKIICYNLYSAYSRQDKEDLSNKYKELNKKYADYLKGE